MVNGVHNDGLNSIRQDEGRTKVTRSVNKYENSPFPDIFLRISGNMHREKLLRMITLSIYLKVTQVGEESVLPIVSNLLHRPLSY